MIPFTFTAATPGRETPLDVGERLQAIRKLKGLSQRELAKRAGVTNSTISMIEKNSVSPSISSLRKVLSGIPMSMMEFFSEELAPESSAQIVYKASELIDISDGEVTMKLRDTLTGIQRGQLPDPHNWMKRLA